MASMLLLAGAVALSASQPSESSLERRVRRFYTYYWLNHYDDMWEVFHPSLREKLGNDKKSYVRSLRRSDLELHESEIRDLRVRGERGEVIVDLVFFFRDVGKPIPRSHRMLWLHDGDKWWYAGSQLLEGGEPLRGELPPEPEEEPSAPAEPTPPATAPSPAVPPAVAGRGQAPPATEPPLPPNQEMEPEDAAPQPSGNAPAGPMPSGVPEVVPPARPAPRPEGHRPELVQRLASLGFLTREKHLRRIEGELVAADIPDLLASLEDLRVSHPVREWAIVQVGRLGRRHPEVRGEALSGLLPLLRESGEGTGLRARAAEAIALLEAPEAREPMELLLRKGNDEQVTAAARGLAALGDPRSLDSLWRAWERRTTPPVRQTVLAAIASIEDPDSAARLVRIAEDASLPAALRDTALRGMVRQASVLGAETFRRFYSREAEDPTLSGSWATRSMAVAGLLRAGEPEEAVLLLDELLEETSRWDMTGEGFILGRALAQPGLLDTIARLLADERPGVRHPAAVAVAELAASGDGEARGLARKALEEERDPRIRAILRPR